MVTVMLDRNIWDNMYKSIELGKNNLPLSKQDLQNLDSLLKMSDVKVVQFNVGEIESYVIRKPSQELNKEKLWLKKKEKEYNCQKFAQIHFIQMIVTL